LDSAQSFHLDPPPSPLRGSPGMTLMFKRYNTNTGVLTTTMFEDVVEKVKKMAKI
jgi:hypothetical protein